MKEILDILKNYWWIWTAIAVGALAVYKAVKIKIPDLIKNQKDIIERLEELENANLITKGHCEMCKEHFCKEIQAVGAKIDEQEKRREKARDEYDQKFLNLNGSLEYIRGRLDTLVEKIA